MNNYPEAHVPAFEVSKGGKSLHWTLLESEARKAFKDTHGECFLFKVDRARCEKELLAHKPAMRFKVAV